MGRRVEKADEVSAVTEDTLEFLRTAGLEEVDPEIAGLAVRELERQRGQIDLIASENYAWPSVLEAVASAPHNKIAEGYPGRRYHGGSEVVDEIEQSAIERATSLFGAEHANVQAHSGTQANLAVYLACLEAGDPILAMRLDQGGHLTHGHAANFSGRIYKVISYGVDRTTGLIQFEQVRQLADEHRPKLIVCGGSAYPRRIEAERFREIADEVGALLLCDMAHFAGLVAVGLHPDPVPYCDFVTATTNKTLAGPRGAFILCKEEHAQAIEKGVFPGTQGSPSLNAIMAKATCFRIAATEAFRGYQAQVRANANALADALRAGGFELVTNGTDTHLLLLDLRPTSWTGRDAEERLREVAVTVNRNAVPFDERPPTIASGLRLGTSAVTMRGFDETDLREVGAIICQALGSDPDIGALRGRSESLCRSRPLDPDFGGFLRGASETAGGHE